MRKKIVFLVFFILIIMNCSLLFSSYESQLDDLVVSLSKTKDKSIQKIAVINFIDTTSKQRFLFSDILETDLNTKIINTGRFKVIEKNRLDEILKELKFGYEGLTDPAQSKQFGKMSQADAILTGTYFERGKQVQVSAKLINIETGEVVWADNISVLKEEIPLGLFQPPNIYQETQIIPVGEKEKYKPKPTGKLILNSDPPQSEIYLDAKPMGITPAILQSVIAGERNITLMKDGYEDYIEKITLNPNETVNKDIKMKKKTGALSIETIPSGAEIYIAGYKKGVSPININLIVGKYKVKATKEDYEVYEKEATIEYKATRKETFNLTEEPGSLLIKVEQPPANVYIDGDNKGEANPKLSFEKFPSGEHTIKITKDGYDDYKQTITIHANKGETISALLKKRQAEEGKKIGQYIIKEPVKGEKVVMDTGTNLMWVWDGNLAGREMTWNNAINYCKNLVYAGYDDWRSPTIDELKTLIKENERPTINNQGFNCLNGWYWSATDVPDDTYAMGVLFGTGTVAHTNKTNTNYFRPVRGGP